MHAICKTFCHYYRPDKEETGGCFPVKIAKTADLDIDVKAVFVFNNRHTVLKALFCPRCDFYPGDCDFHSPGNPGNPCGGYVYFEQLLNKGEIDIERITQLCQTVG